MKKIQNFAIFESFETAKELILDPKLKEVLNDCEEGMYPAVQIVPTPGADSYVVASLVNDPVSEVFSTGDPKLALLMMISALLKTQDPSVIANELTDEDGLLKYSVFAGDRRMTSQEVANKYNIRFHDWDGNALPYLSSTPIRKTY